MKDNKNYRKGMDTNMYEIGIIGGGPAGYHAALEAARCGMSVVLIEEKKPGGVCLFDGCIPTKSLVTSTKAYYHLLKNNTIKADSITFDWDLARAKKEKDIKKLAAGLQMQLKQQNVPIIEAKGYISDVTDQGVIILAGEEKIEVKNVILATGSENVVPPIEGMQELYSKGYAYDSTTLLNTCKPFQKLIVIGAGVIGLELASIYANTGAEVVILEREANFLPFLDDSVKAEYVQSLKRKGIQILLSQEVTKAEYLENVIIESKSLLDGSYESFEADAVLIAAGRRTVLSGCSQELMEKLGVRVERGHIVTDQAGMTGNPHIFACGDVADKNMLAYTAGMEGENAVRFIKARSEGKEYISDVSAVPSVIFSNPEAAFVGLTEAMCKAQEIPYQITKCSMNYSSLFAIENERENGAFELIYHKDNLKILGCHMIGNGASEVIGTVQSYIAEGKTISDITRMPILHPSKLEVIKEAIGMI